MHNLFDIRRIIGALFVVYGIILTITGFVDDKAAIQKALGVRINLWVGIGMLILGVGFLIWERLRPVTLEFQEEVDTSTFGPPPSGHDETPSSRDTE
ncbi:hypothetical protein J5X84_41775 [Streptosporangiaceae bacterium NEAU-GS5]|nr:hypothetical protein [Streptosporangiaceae bacterium NEAU-GS5]